MFAFFGYPSDADNSVCEILAEPREQKRIHTESPDVGAHAPGDRSLKREPETLNELPRVGKSKEADAKPAVVIGTPCRPAQVNPSFPLQRVVPMSKRVPDPVKLDINQRLAAVGNAANKFGQIIATSVQEANASDGQPRILTSEESLSLRAQYEVIAENLGFCFQEPAPAQLPDERALKSFRDAVKLALKRMAHGIVGQAAIDVGDQKVSLAVCEQKWGGQTKVDWVQQLDFKGTVTVGRPYYGNEIVIEAVVQRENYGA